MAQIAHKQRCSMSLSAGHWRHSNAPCNTYRLPALRGRADYSSPAPPSPLARVFTFELGGNYGTGSGGCRTPVDLNVRLMAISREEVRHIAKLARLEFTEAEEQTLAEDMSRILDYMDMLNELDTSEVEAMTHVLDLAHVVRTDSVKKRISQEDALKNAPDTDGEYFRVPKVIG